MSIALITSLLALILNFTYIKVPKKNFKYLLITPITFTSLFIVLYMILGFEAYWQGSYSFLGADYSSTLSRLYSVSSVFIVFLSIFFFAFYYSFKNKNKYKIEEIYKLRPVRVYAFITINVIYAFLAINGIKFPFIHNFIGLFFNACIPLVAFAIITKMQGSKFLLIVFSALIIFLGFRYRLILLYLPIIINLFMSYKISLIKFIKYSTIFFSAIVIVSIVGVARKYSEGLQLEKLEGLDLPDIIIKGIFNDTSTVLTSGAFIQWLDDTGNFAYFKQLWYIINYFIPNQLYPDKEYSPIFTHLSLLTGESDNASGSAVLGFAEYYHTAGYYGVLLFALIFGAFFSKLFKRMVYSPSIYYHYTYFIMITWFINSLTRGYLPQNAQDLISLLIGLYLIKRFSRLYSI